MKASPETILSLAGRVATRIQKHDPEHDAVQGIIGDTNHPFWKAIDVFFAPTGVELVAPTEVLPRAPFVFNCPFSAANTNLDEAIVASEKFAKEVLGAEVNLRERFDFPTMIPWENVLVIFDPGLNNRQVVEKSLQSQKLKVYEESLVEQYSGSEPSAQPTVHIIENCLRPTKDTMGMSPNQLRADGRPYLSLRGYALAFGLRFSVSKDHLDKETWTWFPENRLSSGKVALGRWYPNPVVREVRFGWGSPDYSPSGIGARLAMSVFPKP
jgi:hypothetical protein